MSWAKLKRAVPEHRRQSLRSALRGNPYRVTPGRERVRIAEIVSPLRYDVMIRVRHFERHAERRDLFAADFDAYERLVRDEPYFVWFERSRVPVWWPWLLDDPPAFERAWRERLRASAALYDSFESGGFDPAHPVELYAGRRVRQPATGRRTSRTLFAGDGNHRLALLMAAGHEFLEPSQHRVRRYVSLVPADTTGLLVRETGARWQDYCSFIEHGYPSARVDVCDGRVRVEADDQAVAAEVEAVVTCDLPSLPEGA